MQVPLIRSTPSFTFIGGWELARPPVAATRSAKRFGGNAHIVWRDTYKAWKSAAVVDLAGFRRELEAREAPLPLFGAYVVEAVAVFHRPRFAPTYVRTENGRKVRRPYPLPWTDDRRPYLATPDYDNLAKGVGDCLEAAKVLSNDSTLFWGTSTKWYAAVGELPHTEIRLWRYDERG